MQGLLPLLSSGEEGSVGTPASQPPDHDGGNVGNCDHHCGGHGLIEKGSDGGRKREGRRAERYSIVCGLSAMTWSCPGTLLSRPPAPNYIEFPRRQKGQKVEFTTERRWGDALGHAGIDLGREWQHLSRPKGTPRWPLFTVYTQVYNNPPRKSP